MSCGLSGISQVDSWSIWTCIGLFGNILNMHKTSQSHTVLSPITGKTVLSNITSRNYTPVSNMEWVAFLGICGSHKQPRTERQTWASGRGIVILLEENTVLVWSNPLVFPHLGINSARPLIWRMISIYSSCCAPANFEQFRGLGATGLTLNISQISCVDR